MANPRAIDTPTRNEVKAPGPVVSAMRSMECLEASSSSCASSSASAPLTILLLQDRSIWGVNNAMPVARYSRINAQYIHDQPPLIHRSISNTTTKSMKKIKKELLSVESARQRIGNGLPRTSSKR